MPSSTVSRSPLLYGLSIGLGPLMHYRALATLIDTAVTRPMISASADSGSGELVCGIADEARVVVDHPAPRTKNRHSYPAARRNRWDDRTRLTSCDGQFSSVLHRSRRKNQAG
jgi:hypothetical protein